MPLRIVPDNTNIRFMRLRRIVFPVSSILSIAAVALFIFVGPNYGIDFTGGTTMIVQPSDGDVTTDDIAEARALMASLGAGDVDIQRLTERGTGEETMSIRIGVPPGGEVEQQRIVTAARDAFMEVGQVSQEVVGPRVSSELARNGVIAAIIAMLAIMIYVWFRFEWQFAVGAIIATIHDVVMTLGFFALVKLDFNLTSIAAILTIVGYSLNDTVVVYDRIRETLRKYKTVSISDLIDRAINETLARTTITSLTTWLALWALFIFGGDVIQSFVAAMIFGIAIGTYSSIFIAAPVLIFMKLRGEQLRPAADKTDAGKAAAKPSGK
jgi:preprotein translocase SecF subunit